MVAAWMNFFFVYGVITVFFFFFLRCLGLFQVLFFFYGRKKKGRSVWAETKQQNNMYVRRRKGRRLWCQFINSMKYAVHQFVATPRDWLVDGWSVGWWSATKVKVGCGLGKKVGGSLLSVWRTNAFARVPYPLPDRSRGQDRAWHKVGAVSRKLFLFCIRCHAQRAAAAAAAKGSLPSGTRYAVGQPFFVGTELFFLVSHPT